MGKISRKPDGAAGELKGPTIGIALGDICFDVTELMQNWKNTIIRTGFPFYAVPGNHDYTYELRHNIFKEEQPYQKEVLRGL